MKENYYNRMIFFLFRIYRYKITLYRGSKSGAWPTNGL